MRGLPTLHRFFVLVNWNSFFPLRSEVIAEGGPCAIWRNGQRTSRGQYGDSVLRLNALVLFSLALEHSSNFWHPIKDVLELTHKKR